MNAEKANEEIIAKKKEFNRMMQKIHSEANIKDCFHPSKEKCVLPIKSAHSLQKQGSLRFLEKDKKGNKYLYVHTEREHNFNHNFFDLKATGRKAATTFDGFCDYHDTELFKVIENEPEITDINSDEHLFLHTYRSMAIACHRKFEEWKFYNSDDSEMLNFLNKSYTPRQLFEIKLAVSTALDDLKNPIELINKWILNNQYSEFEYLAFEYPYTIPIGCAAYITPHQMPSGKMIPMTDVSKEQSSILTTVLPFSNRSIVILAAFPDDIMGCEYLEQIDSIKYEIKQQKFLSYFLFDGAENVVVSPHFIDAKPIEWRKKYCNLLSFVASNTTPFLKYDERKFFINYFDSSQAINS